MGINVIGVYRGKTRSFVVDTIYLAPLDVADDRTFDAWLDLPEWDTRTLAEYALSGGARVAPPEFQTFGTKPPPPPKPPVGGTGAARPVLPPHRLVRR